jgi:hypothetical protein
VNHSNYHEIGSNFAGWETSRPITHDPLARLLGLGVHSMSIVPFSNFEH